VRLAFAAAELEAGRRVWSTPDVIALEGWLSREVEEQAARTGTDMPRILSASEDWLLWRQCAAEATRDTDLVNRNALAEALRRSSALAADFHIDVTTLHADAGTEPALLRQVQHAVEVRCRELGAANASSLINRLSGASLAHPVSLCGFSNSSPRITAMAARCGASLMTPGRRQGCRPHALTAPDDLAELERIAAWCKAKLARRADARLLVVLNGSPGARSRLATLIRQAVDPRGWLATVSANSLVVIEGGSPLARNPAISHALMTLRGLAGETAEFEAISEWLRAPYWSAPDDAARAKLDLWLREHAQTQFDLPTLGACLRRIADRGDAASRSVAAAAGAVTGRIDSALGALGPGSASPREWSQRFRNALDALGWPGETMRSSPDQQTLLRFHELLDEFGQLSAVARPMPHPIASHWLSELASRTAFQPADDDAVVTITPMLADPVVTYDGIWVAGLHSDVLPQPVQPDPFLPLPLQLRAGIPASSAAGRLQEARALLGAWSAATDELVLSAPARTGDLELLPSPLLRPYAEAQSGARPAWSSKFTIAAAAGPFWLPVRLHRESLLEAVHDSTGVPWPATADLPGGTRSLDLQNACAFRAYAELRLGTSELGAPEPGVPATERGELLHKSLQLFWKQVKDSRGLQALAEASLAPVIEACVDEAAATVWGGPEATQTPSHVRERARTARLIGSLCGLELERPPFRVDGTELESILKVAGTQVRLRIDRIDVLYNGGRAILDYKSGRHGSADWYGSRPTHPQLLAYLAAMGEDVLAMATVNITARDVRFNGIASSPALLPKVRAAKAPEGCEAENAWSARRREWIAVVERLAAAFVAGEATVDPVKGACEYCHASSFCRIGDQCLEGALGDADTEGGGE